MKRRARSSVAVRRGPGVPALLGVAFLLAACQGGEDSAASDPTLELVDGEVVIDVYSGRENPHLALSPEAANALETELAAATGTFAPGEAVEGLGYRGFVLDATHGGKTYTYTLLPDSVVRTDSAGTVETSADRAQDAYRIVWADVSDDFDDVLDAAVAKPAG